MSDIADTTVPTLPRGVRLREDKARDQWTLLGPERVLNLDEIGVAILQRCDGERDIAAIVEDLCDAFEANATVVAPDVRTFLDDLQRRGFLDLV